MSARRPTEEIVARLAVDLAPVRPVPPLRREATAVLAAWLASAVLALGWIGLHPVETLARGAVSAALLGALGLVGAAGVGLALAARRPGREPIARVAGIVAAVGLAIVAALAISAGGALCDREMLAQGRICCERSLLLAIPSALGAAWFVRGGAPLRSRAAAFGAATGAAALGSLIVHASCRSPLPAHWLTAHALLPLAIGALAGALLAGFVARHDEASARSAAQRLER